jgi:hypothetical protein
VIVGEKHGAGIDPSEGKVSQYSGKQITVTP